jgi:hypothetical protein
MADDGGSTVPSAMHAGDALLEPPPPAPTEPREVVLPEQAMQAKSAT